jgi:O-acetyl-ADP-ribose deacetylase (regulator of RNase III)
MPITYKKGDLLTSEETIIMHGCNSMGVMGSGVAKAIREKYPEAYSAYRKQEEIDGLKLGTYSSVITKDNKLIINAITQKYYGRDGKKYVSYDAISAVAKTLNELYENTSIAIPKIGAGLGGGSWDVIEKILLTYGYAIDWVVYEL